MRRIMGDGTCNWKEFTRNKGRIRLKNIRMEAGGYEIRGEIN